MPTRGEWAIIALIVGAVAVVGVAFYLSRRKTVQGQEMQLVRVKKQDASKNTETPIVVLQNEERIQIVRDGNGALKELLVRRVIHE